MSLLITAILCSLILSVFISLYSGVSPDLAQTSFHLHHAYVTQIFNFTADLKMPALMEYEALSRHLAQIVAPLIKAM